MKLQLTQDLTNILNEMNFKRWGKRDTNGKWDKGSTAAVCSAGGHGKGTLGCVIITFEKKHVLKQLLGVYFLFSTH